MVQCKFCFWPLCGSLAMFHSHAVSSVQVCDSLWDLSCACSWTGPRVSFTLDPACAQLEAGFPLISAALFYCFLVLILQLVQLHFDTPFDWELFFSPCFVLSVMALLSSQVIHCLTQWNSGSCSITCPCYLYLSAISMKQDYCHCPETCH